MPDAQDVRGSEHAEPEKAWIAEFVAVAREDFTEHQNKPEQPLHPLIANKKPSSCRGPS
jgi:hypothetical protein